MGGGKSRPVVEMAVTTLNLELSGASQRLLRPHELVRWPGSRMLFVTNGESDNCPNRALHVLDLSTNRVREIVIEPRASLPENHSVCVDRSSRSIMIARGTSLTDTGP